MGCKIDQARGGLLHDSFFMTGEILSLIKVMFGSSIGLLSAMPRNSFNLINEEDINIVKHSSWCNDFSSRYKESLDCDLC